MAGQAGKWAEQVDPIAFIAVRLGLLVVMVKANRSDEDDYHGQDKTNASSHQVFPVTMELGSMVFWR